MRTPVVITLIIAGAFVIALPPLSDAWRTMMLTQALTHGANFAPWEGLMDGPYRFGCWLLGAVMIGIAITASLAAPSKEAALRLSPSAG